MNPKYVIVLFILSGLFVITAGGWQNNRVRYSPMLRAAYMRSMKSSKDRGSISVYDIDVGHRLVKTIQTVPGVGDVRGVAVSAVTGKLYVAYQDFSGAGMVYCLNVYSDTILWNRAVSPGVDRLAINPDGQLLYVPTWEGGSADYINVLDANTGDVVRKVYFSNRSHDTQYPVIWADFPRDEG